MSGLSYHGSLTPCFSAPLPDWPLLPFDCCKTGIPNGSSTPCSHEPPSSSTNTSCLRTKLVCQDSLVVSHPADDEPEFVQHLKASHFNTMSGGEAPLTQDIAPPVRARRHLLKGTGAARAGPSVGAEAKSVGSARKKIVMSVWVAADFWPRHTLGRRIFDQDAPPERQR